MRMISRVVVCALISSVFFGKTLAENEAMNICYASDEGYAIPTCVSIASILANCPDAKLNILVIDTGLSEKSKKAIENLKKIRDFKLEFRKFDMERLKIFDVGEWSPAIRIKLYMNELFPNAEKAMWVNGNIIFRKNIKQLYDVDLTGKYFAAINCNCHYWDTIVTYNLKDMSRHKIFRNIIDYILQYQYRFRASAGEYALDTYDDKAAKYSLYQHIFCISNLDDDINYKCDMPIAFYFVKRNGFGPWANPRFLYPEIAIETYDEWHKYCDMTDYKGLKKRLEDGYTIGDIYRYYKIRSKRLFDVKCEKFRDWIRKIWRDLWQ